MCPTRQSQHGRVILAVRHPRGVRDAVPPQVGVVVGSGQHNGSHLREGPVLGGKSGAHQDPAAQAAHKATYLHVHHHRPVLHGESSPASTNSQDLSHTERSAWLLAVGNSSALFSRSVALLMFGFCITLSLQWFCPVSILGVPRGMTSHLDACFYSETFASAFTHL